MKKFSAIALIFFTAISFGLTGCGGGSGSDAPSGTLNPAPDPTPGGGGDGGGDGGTGGGGGTTDPTIGPPASIVLTHSLDGSVLSKGGQLTVTATITDSEGSYVANGTEVNFTASAGSITSSAITNGGKAEVVFNAGTSGGTIKITATTGVNLAASLSLQVATGEVASIVKESITPTTIGVKGSGNEEIASILFKVLDGNANPASDGTLVNFVISTPLNGGENLSVASAETAGGLVGVSLQSGTVSGTVKIKATIDGTNISTEASVTIASGLPDAEHISIAAEFLNMAGGVRFGLQDTITAFAGDRYGNVVPDGTPISFISECGTIGTSDGFTTSTNFGEATGVLQTSNPTTPNLSGPSGSGNPGFCQIVAYTPGRETFEDLNGNGIYDEGTDSCRTDLEEPYIDANDNGRWDPGETYIDANNSGTFDGPNGTCDDSSMIWTGMNVLMSDYSGPINLQPSSFGIEVGDSQTFTFDFKDLVGNALVAGSTVQVETTAGTLMGIEEYTQADTVGPGASLSFALYSDLNATDPELAQVTVTISPPAQPGPPHNNGAVVFEYAIGWINLPPASTGTQMVKEVQITLGAESLVADNLAGVTVRAQVIDVNDQPVGNSPVYFASTLGTISTDPVYTDANGYAQTTLTAGSSTGTATVSATAGGFSKTAELPFVAGPPDIVTITAAPNEVKPTGTSTITVTITDKNSNPVAGETVNFSIPAAQNSSGGTVEVSAETNSSGQAIVTYTAGNSVGADTVKAIAASNGESMTTSINVTTAAAALDTLELFAGSTSLAIGSQSVLLQATVKDTEGNPVPSQKVVFAATLGELSGTSETKSADAGAVLEALTNNDGIAKVYLFTGTSTGSATVTANASGLIDSETIAVLAGPPALVDVTAAPETIKPTGSSKITALVTDSFGNAVVGETLNFIVPAATSESGGSVGVSAVTNGSGQATVTYTAGDRVGTEVIKATAASNGISGTKSIVVTTTAAALDSIDLFVGSSSLAVGGSESVLLQATVKDTDGNPVPSQEVVFSVSLGLLSNSPTAAPAPGTQKITLSTNATGVAKAYLYAGTTTGAAGVTVNASGLIDTDNVAFIAGPPDTVIVTSAPNTVKPTGSTKITATVADINGNPVVGETVNFKIPVANNESAGTVEAAAVTNANGQAVVTYTAGNATGTDRVEATAGSNGQSGSVDILVSTLAADLDTIELFAGSTTLQVGGHYVLLRATIKDTEGNPVTSQPVDFSTTLGDLGADPAVPPGAGTSSTLSVNTDNNGVARVYLFSADDIGTANVRANASGLIDDVVINFIAGPPATVSVNAAPNVIKPTGSSRITATVTDSEGNPVVGEIVNFNVSTNTSNGSLSPASTITDANGQATVLYTAGDGTGTDTIKATASSNTRSGTVDIDVSTLAADLNSIELFAGSTILPVGGNQVLLRATIKDTEGNPVTSQPVDISTSLGSLAATPSGPGAGTSLTVNTDSNGVARAYLFSGDVTGTANVRANASGLIDDVTVQIVAGSPATVEVTASPEIIKPTGSSTVTATVLDSLGNWVVGETVVFNITSNSSGGSLGSVTAPTNASGQAKITYTAGAGLGIDTVSATTSSNTKTGTVDISVDPGTSGFLQSIQLTTGGQTIVADGSSEVLLRATVLDSDGNPAPSQTVSFKATAGTLSSGTGVTDQNGIAEVFLTAPPNLGTALVIATVGGINDSATVGFVAGEVASITLTSSPNTVGSGGQATLSAFVTDANDNPVAEESIQFYFADPADNISGGILETVFGTTDVNGRIRVVYTAGSNPGTDTVSVRATNGTLDSVNITVSDTVANIGSLDLMAVSEIITADGISTSLIQAIVLGTDGLPKAGITVDFATTQGVFQSTGDSDTSVPTDSNGIAAVELQSLVKPALAYITASTAGFNAQAQVRFVPGGPVEEYSSITANPSTIPADPGFSTTVTVFLADANNNAVEDGTLVTLRSTAGTILEPTASTTVSGRATFILQAPSFQETADLTISEVAGLLGTVTFGSQPPGDPANILLEVTDQHLFVAGVGQVENTTITATVTDAEGNPINESEYSNPDQDNLRVSFITSPHGGEYLTGTNWDGVAVTAGADEQMTVRTRDGIATLNLQSGTLPGVVEILFEALLDVDGNAVIPPQVVASLPQVTIASGSPHTIRLASPFASVEDLANGFYRRQGTAVVTDRYGNSVPDGTIINLGLMDSIIAEGTATTTEGSAELNAVDVFLADDNPANFLNAFITRNNTERFIQKDDRVLLLNAQAGDKSRFVAQGLTGATADDLLVQTFYNNSGVNREFVVGAALLGGHIAGFTDEGALPPGLGETKDGLAPFRITYPADETTILVGCGSNLAARDVRHLPRNSARVYVTASSSDRSASTISEDFCFTALAPATYSATPAALNLGAGTYFVDISVVDATNIPLSFLDIPYAVGYDSIGRFDACADRDQALYVDAASCEGDGLMWYGDAGNGFCIDPYINEEGACGDEADPTNPWRWLTEMMSDFGVEVFIGYEASLDPDDDGDLLPEDNDPDVDRAQAVLLDTDGDGTDDFYHYPYTLYPPTVTYPGHATAKVIVSGDFVQQGDTATINFGGAEVTVTIP